MSNYFPPKIWNKARMSLSLLLFNIVWEVLGSAMRQAKERKGIQIRKEGIKLSLLTDDMTVYIKRSQIIYYKNTQSLRISEFMKVTEYKILIQKVNCIPPISTMHDYNLNFIIADNSTKKCIDKNLTDSNRICMWKTTKH